MKKLIGMLPVLGLVLGVVAAFASHTSEGNVVNTKKAFIGGSWQDISGQVLNQDYVCDTAPTHNCTADFNPQGQMVPGTLIKGDYRDL